MASIEEVKAVLAQAAEHRSEAVNLIQGTTQAAQQYIGILG